MATCAAVSISVAIAWLLPAEARTSGGWVLGFGAGAALGILVLTARSEWSRVGRWSALLVLGQGAALSWIDAGPEIHYQHLRLPFDSWGAVGGIAVAILVVQALALVIAGRPALSRALHFVQTQGSSLRWIVTALAVVMTAAALSRDPGFYMGELVWASTLQAVALACLLATAFSLTASQADHIGAAVSTLLEDRRLPFAVAIWVLLSTAALSWFVYQRHPHVPDEVVYLLQARYFAAGLWELPLPPVLAAFDLDLMSSDPSRWFVPVTPAWPAALSVGVRAGVPWLVNPLFGALSVLLVHGFVRDLHGTRTAGATTCLLGISPWFLFLNMSLMTHSFTLLAVAAAALATGKLARGSGIQWAVLAGCGLGLVALNRPLEGLIAAALLGIWALLPTHDPPSGRGTVRGTRRRILDVGVMAVLSAGVVATMFPYNARFTGEPLTFPINEYMNQTYGEGSNDMGFGAEKGVGFGGLDPFPGHGPADVAVNSALNLFQINTELSGWSVGSTVAIGLFLFVAGGLAIADLGMVAAVLLVAGAHALYWFSGGPDFGARYWYLTLIPLLILVVRSSTRLARLSSEPGRVAFAVALLCASSLFVFTPWRASDKYWQYRGMEPGILALSLENQWGATDVVLVRGDPHPDYASAAVYNPLDLRGDGPIYAWDGGADVQAALFAAYPNRRFWSVDGPTLTGNGFVVRSGPTSD